MNLKNKEDYNSKDISFPNEISFGKHWSYNFRNDPKRLPFVMARYMFASKMTDNKSTLLELGCSDAIGTSILAQKKCKYVGVDLDKTALDAAMENFKDENRYEFIYDDFMGKFYGNFDSVVSLDVVEHILQEHENQYFETITANLNPSGIAVIGTPNITASAYASEASQIGHVNLFSQERLIGKLEEHFHYVFPFGMNDEVVHTGYAPMCHYLICVACQKK